MKIAIISSWYSENMGYAENFLPKAFAKLGHEVHLLTSTAQVYYNSPDYAKTYEPFIGKNILEPIHKMVDGYHLHRAPFKKAWVGNVPIILNMEKYLNEIQPDIIQTFDVDSINTYHAARYCQKVGLPLFTESHVHASVFKSGDWKLKLEEMYNGVARHCRFVNQQTTLHYPIALDVMELSIQHFKVPAEKNKLQSLGVDTSFFKPAAAENAARNAALRKNLGFADSDMICLYTGRFTPDKNPLCLAQAVDLLQKNGEKHIKALFVGSGTEENIRDIAACEGCITHPFVQVDALPPFYHISDVGVWPKQESTSQLDAMACGLPIIVSDKVQVMDRIEGNGLLYRENDAQDLAQKISQLDKAEVRQQLGKIGLEKIQSTYSWEAIAAQRLGDYTLAMQKKI